MSQITCLFVKCSCLVYFFLNSANLVCQSMDISKCSGRPLDFEITKVNCNVEMDVTPNHYFVHLVIK